VGVDILRRSLEYQRSCLHAFSYQVIDNIDLVRARAVCAGHRHRGSCGSRRGMACGASAKRKQRKGKASGKGTSGWASQEHGMMKRKKDAEIFKAGDVAGKKKNKKK